MFKVALAAMLILFGAVAVFLGGVTAWAALRNGELNYVLGGNSVTLLRSADPSGYWRALLIAGVLPIIGGMAAVVFGRRQLRSL
jgi:hypothetical protein